MRTSFDFTPYRRSTIGFDRLFELLENQARADGGDSYPPFDIEKTAEDRYQITLAVAGFAPGEIDIVAQQNLLTVTGRKGEDTDTGRFLHRGIATRAFERRFQLADFVVVDGARFDNGLLRIALRREVPDAMKPRKIEIAAQGTPANDLIEATRESGEQAA